MAELASGAVRSLLGVLRDEARLLGRVEGDLKFIQEEMESMNSFLQHLDRTTPPGDHDEQVRTWMKHVRDLAYACSNCIDLYLLRGDAAVYRATGPMGRYLWWVPWYLRKLYAQHCAAIQLRELKARAHDVGKRRLRYDVKIPKKSDSKPSGPEATTSSSQATGGGDEGIIPSDDEQTPEDEAMRALAFAETRILEECTQELVNWLSCTEERARSLKGRLPSIAIAAPDEEDGADVAREALAHPSVATKFKQELWITFPWFWLATPLDILRKILGKLLPEPGEVERAVTEKLDRKIEEIVMKTEDQRSRRVVPLEPLDILCDILQELLPKPVQSVGKDKIQEKKKIDETAMKIKEYLEELGTKKSGIGLDHSEYVGILQELLPQPKEDKPVKLLPEPEEDTDKLVEDQMPNEKIEEIIQNIRGTLQNIKERLLVKEIAKKIKEHLKGKRTIIVLDGSYYAYKWWETKRALNQLGCATGSSVIVTTNYTQGASQYCNPTREAIIYSLVPFYYSKVLPFTSRRKNKDWNVNILREILQHCEHHEFCMKMFVHAMYVNPNKSKEDLEKLRDNLDSSVPLDINAKKMFMFSYGDLPRDYKTCLLYLAIFPRGHKIRRSTSVGRWVADGLITKDDWPSSVHRAERCFDVLVNRWLVYPGDIGAAGKVKSCIVHDIVHEFITKIARKEHFVDTRLSHHWARHFSVLSDVRLRSSDSIEKFLQNLYRIPQLPLVKVLDLEDCRYFNKNQHYLKNICNTMLLLKYLSLRNTDITKLPKEINNLCQLEVLDLRQTHVDASTTRYLMLLNLKRLLASCNIDTNTTRTDNINRTKKSFDAVELPHGIKKMTNMEVMSHVEASEGGAHLKDIGNLWQLRKLGVVIHNKEAHLKKLVQVIDDLNESLQSLSISIKSSQASSQVTLSNTGISLKNSLKLLESLRIRGMTSGRLLTLLVKHCDQLAKVTLHNTHLNQDNLKDLGQLPKLRGVRLRHVSYTESHLIFKNQEFQNLKYFLVEGSNMTKISFENGASPELEKIVLSSTNMNSISFENEAAPKLEEIALPSTTITTITFENGAAPNFRKTVLSYTNMECLSRIDNLIGLKEIELNGSGITSGALLSLFTNANQIAKVTLRDTLLRQCDLQILAKQPNIRCLILLEKSCDERQLTFNKDEFPNLKLLVVECFDITNISFLLSSAPKLEKIVWSFTKMESLSGINNLLALKDLEFNGVLVPDRVRQAIKAHPNDPDFKHNKPQNEDKAKGSTPEADDAARFPFFWKNWGRC